MGCVAAFGLAGLRWFIARMDAVRSTMTPDDSAAIGQFRRLHISGMVLNVVLLAGFCIGMTQVSL